MLALGQFAPSNTVLLGVIGVLLAYCVVITYLWWKTSRTKPSADISLLSKTDGNTEQDTRQARAGASTHIPKPNANTQGDTPADVSAPAAPDNRTRRITNLRAPGRQKGATYQQKADEAQHLNQTIRKFVPRQFVEHFAKHGSDSLELGRADEDNVAILFCDIRGFTGLSELMSPQELMNFLNSYFVRMNAPIHENNGFIDKFIGDAIMALFDHPNGSSKDKAQDAIKAALQLRQALNLYNEHRGNSGYAAINIGIGIHFGPVILGTVGSDDRIDTTVIGDNVNVAQRLESLAPVYQVDIVVSEVLINTAQAYEDFEYRLIDWVKLRGRSEAVKVYEVFSHLDDAARFAKLEVASLIQRGIDARITRDMPLARAIFAEAHNISPNDSVVNHHLALCDKFETHDKVIDWDGAAFVGHE